jgi:hypothetical protein
MMTWQELLVEIFKIKEEVLSLLFKMKALLFSIQYGQANFSNMLHPEIILYTRKSFIVHIKVVFI